MKPAKGNENADGIIRAVNKTINGTKPVFGKGGDVRPGLTGFVK
jgi:hypothetical protein